MADLESIVAGVDVRALREALDQCMRQFAFYATEHVKAGKHEKAATNQRFADLCHEALTRQPTSAVVGAIPEASVDKVAQAIFERRAANQPTMGYPAVQGAWEDLHEANRVRYRAEAMAALAATGIAHDR